MSAKSWIHPDLSLQILRVPWVKGGSRELGDPLSPGSDSHLPTAFPSNSEFVPVK